MLMQMHGLLDTLPLWALFVATLVIALLSFEGGVWGGKRRSQRSEREQEVVGGGLVEGMLGLAAFLLAFTFGAAATHFDARRQAIIDEANAIRETYLRADFLPEPHRAETRNLLREYVDVQLEGLRSGKIEQAIARSEELHDQLWLQASASREKASTSEFAAKIIEPLNQIVALHTRRMIVGLEFRIPNIIWIVLYVVTALAAASIGYHSGLTRSRRPPIALAVILAFSTVIFLIEELDRPGQGFIQVSQRALVDLQTKMNAQTR